MNFCLSEQIGWFDNDIRGLYDGYSSHWKTTFSLDIKYQYVREENQVIFWIVINKEGARGVIVIVVGNEHGDTSSNPGRDWLHFT